MLADARRYFVYHQSMHVVQDNDTAVSRIAAAIGEPARARMLFCLMDGHARTGTELAVVANVSPSTASVHLHRLTTAALIKVLIQGKHRYYSLRSAEVAAVLEGLSVLAGGVRDKFVPTAPNRLCEARTCYDHMAGRVGVLLHDSFHAFRWLSSTPKTDNNTYEVTPAGTRAFEAMGIDLEATRALRRRFACACLDWSERRPHIGGALGAAFLTVTLKRKWATQDLDSRALTITRFGKRELLNRFAITL